MQDLSTQVLFQAFNHVWRNSPQFFDDPLNVPFCLCYEVFPTATHKGFMEEVKGLRSLKEYDWKRWMLKHGRDPVAVDNMVRSAAGSYAGAYVLGARDRHWDNILIQNDSTLFHIDFGFLLGKTPPIDGPRFSISHGMESVFKKLNVWELFVETSVRAFLALRSSSSAIVRTAVLLFGKAGYEPGAVRSFLRSRFSLNLHEKNEAAAAAFVRNQIQSSSTDWKTKLKAFSHQHIDPGWYGLLERGFPPAVAIMKLIDGKEQKSARRVAAAAARFAREFEAPPLRLGDDSLDYSKQSGV